jgi:hypothetical protein
MTSKPGVSRRMFMRSAAAAAAVPTVLTATQASASSAVAHVAATVVRASHSKTAAGRLTIGVRASVLAEGFNGKNVVVTVDDVRFGASADETKSLITKAVQDRIASMMSERGAQVTPDRIAVQVFGGVL